MPRSKLARAPQLGGAADGGGASRLPARSQTAAAILVPPKSSPSTTGAWVIMPALIKARIMPLRRLLGQYPNYLGRTRARDVTEPSRFARPRRQAGALAAVLGRMSEEVPVTVTTADGPADAQPVPRPAGTRHRTPAPGRLLRRMPRPERSRAQARCGRRPARSAARPPLIRAMNEQLLLEPHPRPRPVLAGRPGPAVGPVQADGVAGAGQRRAGRAGAGRGPADRACPAGPPGCTRSGRRPGSCSASTSAASTCAARSPTWPARSWPSASRPVERVQRARPGRRAGRAWPTSCARRRACPGRT